MLAATRVALLALALTSSTFAVPDDGPAPLPPSECAGNVEEGNNKDGNAIESPLFTGAICCRELYLLCGAHKNPYNQTACALCIVANHNQTVGAGCTFTDTQDFCNTAPPPPPPPSPSQQAHCSVTLQKLCGPDHTSQTECAACINGPNAIPIAEAGCSKQAIIFCDEQVDNPLPLRTSCCEVIGIYCGVHVGDHAACVACIATHSVPISAACVPGYDVDFCGTPLPEPCETALATICGSVQNDFALCTACIYNPANAQALSQCTSIEKLTFCSPVAIETGE